MSLADIYKERYASKEEGQSEDQEKLAADASEIEQLLGQFSDEEVSRLDAAGNLLDSYGLEFESGQDKLAAAAELLDKLEADAEEGEESKEGSDDAESEDDNLIVDDEGNVFQYLGNTSELEDEEDDATKQAADYEAAGRLMGRGFLAEVNGE